MYQVHGWWLPDQDTHFAEMLAKSIAKIGRPVYQEAAREASLRLSKKRRGVALDIGANVGLWSRDLCANFQHVIAFEPVSEFRACLQKNVPNPNLEIIDLALGDTNTTIDMIITPGNTGHSHVDTNSYGQGRIHMVTLDSLQFPTIDYIKIDCEGFENKILHGAKQTIMSSRPIMVIEDKKHQDVGHRDTESALNTLLSWGAQILKTVNRDHVLGWR